MESTNLLGKVDHQVSGRDQLSVRYSMYGVDAENSRGAGGLSAPSASSALDNRDQTIALGNTLTISSRTVNETRAQFSHGDLKAPPTDPIGPAVSISGIASFGTSSGSPTGRLNNLYQVVNNVSHQAGAHAFRVGVDFLYNDDRIDISPFRPRQLYVLVARQLPDGHVQQCRLHPDIRCDRGVANQSERRPVRAGRMEGRLPGHAEPRSAIRSPVPGNHRHGCEQRLATSRLRLDAVRLAAGCSSGGALASSTIVCRCGALANALLSAGNTTDIAHLRQIGVSLAPTQEGAPVFPDILPGVVPSVTLVNLTTMDRNLQNACSRQASVEVEQQLGDRVTIGVGYQYLRGQNLLMSVNQNVPACAASGTNNGCRPNPDYANNSQYSSVGDSSYHGLHLSFLQRPTRWGHYRVSVHVVEVDGQLGEVLLQLAN